MINAFKKILIVFSKLKLMQWLKSPLKSKGPKFEPFPEFYFSFTNEMDQNKLSFDKKFNLSVQE
jgi:hypothetical protein